MGSRIINLGIGMMMIGLAAILLLIWMDVVQSHWLSLIPAMLIYGAGQGLVMPTLTRTVLSNVSHGDVGSASGLFTTIQQIAMAVGVTVISSVFYSLLGPEPLAEALSQGHDSRPLHKHAAVRHQLRTGPVFAPRGSPRCAAHGMTK